MRFILATILIHTSYIFWSKTWLYNFDKLFEHIHLDSILWTKIESNLYQKYVWMFEVWILNSIQDKSDQFQTESNLLNFDNFWNIQHQSSYVVPLWSLLSIHNA